MDAVVERQVDLLEGDVFEVGRARQRERAEGFLGLPAAAAFDDDPLDVVGAEGAEALRVRDGGQYFLAAEAIDEMKDLVEMAVERDLGQRQPLEVGGGGLAERGEPVKRRAAAAAALRVEERLDVGLVDDVVAAADVSCVARDLLVGGVDGDFGGGRLQEQRAPGVGGRDAVVVAFEGDAAERACANGAHDAGVVGRLRDRAEEGSLFVPDVDRPSVRRSVLAHVGDLIEPVAHGAVGFFEGGERAAFEEALFEVFDSVFDAALFVRAVGCTGDRLEAVVV